MPNHFHLLLCANDKGVELKKGTNSKQVLSHNIGIMLSSYTQAINRQENRKGSLFAHSTKSIMLNLKGNDYLLNCFMYIHQNPLLAGIVGRIEDWEYSSYPDYIGKRDGSLINVNLGLDVLNIDKEDIEIITNQLLIDKTDEDFL
jgi:REP element-mobilizing transposase RayT